MELIHYDYNWFGINGPQEYDDLEEDKIIPDDKFLEIKVIKIRKPFSSRFSDLS